MVVIVVYFQVKLVCWSSLALGKSNLLLQLFQ